jgi:ABC-type transport system substrate-binding protein
MAAVATLAIVASACAPAAPAPSQPGPMADGPRKGGTFTRPVLYGDPATLDPILSVRVAAVMITMNVYSQLIDYDFDQKAYVGDLAETWNISQDGLAMTFNLRKGVMFHNGREVRASDLKYSFERVLDKKWPAAGFATLLKVRGAEDFREGRAPEVIGLKAPDDYTFVVELNETDALFFGDLASVAYSAVPRDEVEKHGLEFGTRGPVGSGPFKFESYAKDDAVVLTRFDQYYNGPAHLERLIFRNMPEAGTRQNEFLAGNLDAMVLTDAQYRQFRQDPAWKDHLVEVPELFTRTLMMNVTRKPFDDVRVRQAMNYAVNRPETIDNVLYGKAFLATGPMPSSMPGYDANLTGYPYDPARAKDLLAAAGYANGFEVELMAGTHPVVGAKAADILKPYYDPLGIKLNVRQVEGATQVQLMEAGDFVLTGWSTGGTIDPVAFLWSRFHSRNHGLAGNYTRYSNPKVDEILDRARVTLDEQERLRLAAEANSIITEETPWLIWHYNKAVQIVQPWVRGFKPIPTDVDFQDMHQVWIDSAQKS